MIVKSFRIENYKSIIDSGECFIEKDLTVFAGKNESGKTSILESLNDFNVNNKIDASSRRIGTIPSIPKIHITFIVTAEELNKYFKQIRLEKHVNSSQEISISKVFPNTYFFDDKTNEFLDIENKEDNAKLKEIEKKVYTSFLKLQLTHQQYFARFKRELFVVDTKDLVSLRKNMIGYNQSIQIYLRQIGNINVNVAYNQDFNAFQKTVDEFENALKNIKNNWPIFSRLLPNFILFRSFEDILPNEIAYDDLDSNEFISDLKVISNINTTLVKSSDSRNKLQHQKEINVKFNEEYSKFWLQDLTKIKIHWDNGFLQFWIEEDDILYKPSERSKGKQWHMSFYIKVTARAKEDRVNVILIDEPGLYLHATAQNDIYQKLVEISKKATIIYTTHSPYLINRDELHRVRLVVKSDKTLKTKVENKIHAKSDKETLTPILTAIGLGLNDGIQSINQENNIVVEGPADYFYLQAMKKVLRDNQSINFIFGGGAGNMGSIGAILSGWGCRTIYLYDNDQGFKDGSKNLIKTWHVKKDLILKINEKSGSIEDLFSIADFSKYVLKEENKYDISSSEYIKNNKLNKVILSKAFNSICCTENIKLDKVTQINFTNLFNEFDRLFE